MVNMPDEFEGEESRGIRDIQLLDISFSFYYQRRLGNQKEKLMFQLAIRLL